jgi:hypothetical protein
MNCKEKLNIVLDLDNTLISSLSFKELNKVYRKRKRDNSGKSLKYSDMENYYRIFHRPYLQEFLDFIFENFNVSIWTAASKDYALFIVSNILHVKSSHENGKNPVNRANRAFKLICYDEHCEQSELMYNSSTPKDLNYLYNFNIGFHPCNTIIIDDLIHVEKANTNHTIRADYFDASKAEAVNDDFLKRTIENLKEIKKTYENSCCIHGVGITISGGANSMEKDEEEDVMDTSWDKFNTDKFVYIREQKEISA